MTLMEATVHADGAVAPVARRVATVLVVDDVPANRGLMAALLSREGHRVLEAADGAAGLAAVHADRPDIIITDVLMPVMDGYELVRRLRLDPSTSAIPIVLYTAHYGEREARDFAALEGVSGVVIKPVRAAEVIEIVARVLSGDGASHTPAGAREAPREHLRLLPRSADAEGRDLRVANARLSALVNIGMELASERDADRMLERVCVAARDLFGASYATLGVLEDDGGTVKRFLSCGGEAGCDVDIREWIRIGEPVPGVLREVVGERRTLRRDNAGGEPATLGLPALHPEVRSFLVAPVASLDRVYGWISLVSNEGRSFTADDEHLVQALAGQVGRVYELEHEIQVRKRAELALRTAEERMRFILESAGVGIWDMDYATGILRWSRILESQYGIEPGTFKGTFGAFAELISAEDRQATLDTVGKAMKSGSEFTVSNRAVWPDGSVHWLAGKGRIHLGEHGEPVRGVGISLDVTERRTLEAQYSHAQKMEAIGRLAGGVAHDFNNLLTAILGYCYLLLLDFGPGDPRRADIAEIQKAGESGAALTRQLLAFSRKEVIEPMLLDLNTIVAGMESLLTRLIGEDVPMTMRLLPELPAMVMADRGQLEQVVMNLAVNARDAMPEGGRLTIEVACVELGDAFARIHAGTKAGRHVALTMTDSGTGMSPEVQSHLFEPFFTTKESGRGTGLGLSTVHGIVIRSGGSITVSSEIGTGTAFTVYLPQADAAGHVATPPAGDARPGGGSETVLVVEDAESLRALTRKLLERLGYTVLVAANANEALRRFAENVSIDVLLTDVVMPGGSGSELSRELVELRPGLKVIYMSGYTEDAIAHHRVLTRGVAFLQKPFTAEALGRKIREVLDRQPSR